jgi:hypothetical protein
LGFAVLSKTYLRHFYPKEIPEKDSTVKKSGEFSHRWTQSANYIQNINKLTKVPVKPG